MRHCCREEPRLFTLGYPTLEKFVPATAAPLPDPHVTTISCAASPICPRRLSLRPCRRRRYEYAQYQLRPQHTPTRLPLSPSPAAGRRPSLRSAKAHKMRLRELQHEQRRTRVKRREMIMVFPSTSTPVTAPMNPLRLGPSSSGASGGIPCRASASLSSGSRLRACRCTRSVSAQ